MAEPVPEGFMHHTRKSGLTDPWEPIYAVSLTADFLATARQGQWITFETRFTRHGSSLSFADSFVTADGEPCARISGTFRALRKTSA